MKNFSILLLCSTLVLGGSANAEDTMNRDKIINLDPSQVQTVETFAIEDYSFMKVTGGDKPESGTVPAFTSIDGKFSVGFSHFTQVSLALDGWPADEFMYFLEGQVEITNEDGSSKIYGPGDALVMPKGFKGTWRQISPIKKIHISYAGTDASPE